MLSTYRTLLRLPLFQGMSDAELDVAVSRLRMDFSKWSAGQKMVSAGDAAAGLIFLISGEVSSSASADDGGYTIEEWLPSPRVFQPECLFGLTQRYTHTYSALTDCGTLMVRKSDVMMLFSQSEVFRLNFLNILSTLSQRSLRQPWRKSPDGISSEIAAFIANRSTYPAGSKTLHIGMVRLACEIGESRQNVSDTLNAMQREGLLRLSRSRIEVPALEKLL